MKCPKCGAASDVLETRPYKAVFLRRGRRCHNGHKFTTYEVRAGNLDRRTFEASRRGAAGRLVAAQRRKAVLAAPSESASALAARLGCTEARVRQIRGNT